MPITRTSVSTHLYLYSPIIIILFDNATCNLAIFYSTTVFLIFLITRTYITSLGSRPPRHPFRVLNVCHLRIIKTHTERGTEANI